MTINSSQCNESTIDSGAHVGPFAYIRPNCHVGADVKVGDFVELKNSTIGEGTKISHLTYVGDADVGRKVNFGCGTVLVNYDGNRKYRSTIGDHCFIGCNTNLVSPVHIGDGAYTAAGSTITQDVEPDALAIARAPAGGKARLGRRPSGQEGRQVAPALLWFHIRSDKHPRTAEKGKRGRPTLDRVLKLSMITHGKSIKIFTGNSNPELAKAICQELGVPLGNAEVGSFADGENYASIYETVRGSDVFVVQSTCPFEKDGVAHTVNDALMELLIMIDALKARLRRTDHRGDPLFRLRPPGPEDQAPRPHLRQAGGQPDHPRRRRPGTDHGPARQPDPGLL